MILSLTLKAITWKKHAQRETLNLRIIFLYSAVKLPLRKPVIH